MHLMIYTVQECCFSCPFVHIVGLDYLHAQLLISVFLQGLFEILSLSGSFMPNESGGGTRSRSGGMSVSLASPDGRVVGGGVAGLLVAASPVQVIILSVRENICKLKVK